MIVRFAVILPVLGACRSFESVEEACKDSVPGDKDASDAAIDVMQRIGCYRRYAGLNTAKLNPRVTEAVEAHAFYLQENGVDPVNWPLEAAGETGFTGVDSYDRMTASEYLTPETSSYSFIWDIIGQVDPNESRAAMADWYMQDPFYRDAFLSPSWEAGGYAEFADTEETVAFFMNIVLYYPSGARSNKPVTYPVDGQTGIPISWENWLVGDPNLTGVPAVTGYPITFTCGSSDDVGGDNPLQVAVLSSTISGPEGPIDHVVALPGMYGGGVNNSTAILFPSTPFAPNTAYTVDATLSWIDVPEKDLSFSFTTGTEDVPSYTEFIARRTGPRP